MEEFKLKYGSTNLELSQSKKFVGLRPKHNQTAEVTTAVQKVLGDSAWNDAGYVGGFRIIAIDDVGVDTDQALDMMRADDSVSSGTHVFEVPGGGGLVVPTGDLFVEFKPDAGDDVRQAAIDEFKLSIKEARGDDGFIVGVTPASPNPVKVAAGLQNNPAVVIAEPDLASRVSAKATPFSDALLSEQWHLRNTGRHRGSTTGFVKGADGRVLDAWDLTGNVGKPEVVVAVIDDGFDLDHPDLSVPNKVVNPWDFTRSTPNPRPGPGDWHGTACAGVAVAALNGVGVIGSAPGCTLMPVRWGRDLSDSQIEAWFQYVTTKGAWVVSCSWGAANPFFPLSTRASRAISKCAAEGRGGKGCVVVFAAGNENHDINNPAGFTVDGFAIHPDVISVAASTSRDERSHYSNFGKAISICAPSSGSGGWGILTADVTGVDPNTGVALGYAQGDYTYDFGGTSSACPLVAGICGLLLSINPDLTAGQVKKLLQDTARKIGPGASYTNGHSPLFGYGCVDAAAAINQAMPQAPVAYTPKKVKAKAQKTKAVKQAKVVAPVQLFALDETPASELAKEISAKAGLDLHVDPDDTTVSPPVAFAAATDWRVAKSLLHLRNQVNAKAPGRSKASDGTIGDARHRSRSSDHNPWVLDGTIGVVTAMDITHDAGHGCDAGELAKAIVASRDNRVKYVIWNKQISSSLPQGGKPAWHWRPYGGSNPHSKHCHISVNSEKSRYDSERNWVIP